MPSHPSGASLSSPVHPGTHSRFLYSSLPPFLSSLAAFSPLRPFTPAPAHTHFLHSSIPSFPTAPSAVQSRIVTRFPDSYHFRPRSNTSQKKDSINLTGRYVTNPEGTSVKQSKRRAEGKISPQALLTPRNRRYKYPSLQGANHPSLHFDL